MTGETRGRTQTSMSDSANLKPRFVILAAPRSGSNMLCAMLGSHPQILCHHEIFNPQGIRLALQLRETGFVLGTVAEREQNPAAFLARIWANAHNFSCVGFKLTHRQNELVYRRLLADATVAKVILRRQNRVKIYVSRCISELLAEWEVYREQDLIRERPRVTFDVPRFLDEVAFDEAYYAEIRNAVENQGHAWIEVLYESLSSIPEQNRMVRFLTAEPIQGGLDIRSVKQNSRNLRDLILNYDEVVRSLAGTEFEAELQDLND